MTGTPVRFDIVSDIVCPWCAIGIAALEQALARVGDGVDATIEFHPLQLNPGLPPEGELIVDNMARKYGASSDQARATGGRIRAAAAEVDVPMAAHRERLYDTFDAHRLLHWANLEGRQPALKHALLDAYFERGENVSDHSVLIAAAARAGLDPAAAQTVLTDDLYAGNVRASENYWRGEGILSVPTIILDGQFVIPGAQSVDRLEKAIRRRMEAAQAG